MDTIRLKNNFGFSLVELLVTLVVMSIVTGAVYLTFGSQRNVFEDEEKKLDLQLNSRVAMDRLVWLFQHTGFGAADSFKYGGTTMTDGASTFKRALTVNNQTSSGTNVNSDNVTLVLGFIKVADVNGNFNEVNKINLTLDSDAPAISNSGFTKYICFSPYPENVFFRVTSAANPTYTLNGQVRKLRNNTEVYMVAPIKLAINNINRGSYTIPVLYARNLAYNNIADWEVADGIQDIQFQYTENDGTTWLNQPANPVNVNAVRIFMLARSTVPDPDYQDTNTYNYAGSAVGPFNDNFHRMLTTATVWLRNQ